MMYFLSNFALPRLRLSARRQACGHRPGGEQPGRPAEWAVLAEQLPTFPESKGQSADIVEASVRQAVPNLVRQTAVAADWRPAAPRAQLLHVWANRHVVPPDVNLGEFWDGVGSTTDAICAEEQTFNNGRPPETKTNNTGQYFGFTLSPDMASLNLKGNCPSRAGRSPHKSILNRRARRSAHWS